MSKQGASRERFDAAIDAGVDAAIDAARAEIATGAARAEIAVEAAARAMHRERLEALARLGTVRAELEADFEANVNAFVLPLFTDRDRREVLAVAVEKLVTAYLVRHDGVSREAHGIYILGCRETVRSVAREVLVGQIAVRAGRALSDVPHAANGEVTS